MLPPAFGATRAKKANSSDSFDSSADLPNLAKNQKNQKNQPIPGGGHGTDMASASANPRVKVGEVFDAVAGGATREAR